MKKLLIILSILFVCSFSYGQTYKIVNGEITEVVKSKSKTDTKTKFTVIKKGITYVVWKSKKGKYYIIRTSLRSGNKYRQYLKVEEKK